jgi:hypothetical protein
MSCTNKADRALAVAATPTGVGWRWLALATAVVAIRDAFQEALDLRRAAHRRCPFNE